MAGGKAHKAATIQVQPFPPTRAWPMSSVHDSDTDSGAGSTPAVLVKLLGEPAWQRPGHALTSFSPKDAALIAKLAIDGPQARTTLCELLWPEASADKAADSLRQRVSRLNRAAACKFVELGSNVRLPPHVSVDVAQPAALGPDALMQAGALLAGLDLGDNDELDRWLVHARTQVAEACAQVLADRAEALEREGRLHEALPLARRVVELVPVAEHGWRRLMRLHYLRNDRAAAQEAFWRLTSLLRDELGIRPSAETLQLMQTVEAADPIHALPHRPVPASVLRPPILVGRTQAWQAMSAAWQRPEPFLLIGEAGLGKSRLLEDFTRGKEGVVADRAQPGDEHSPYSLLGRTLLQIDHRFAPELSAGVRTELARLRPEFGPAPEAPAHAPVLWHAIQQLLAAAIDQGLQAIVLDDLHDADRATIEALRWLSTSPALSTLRLGLATRPQQSNVAGSPLMAWLEDSHRLIPVNLQPLTQDELSELLISLALPSLLDAEVAVQMYRHAGGHPLYTLATLQDALARGTDLRALQLPRPGSVQALLDARLRGLPPVAQDLLRVAAVAGADLRADRAARLLNCSLLALADTWALLEAANVLRGEAFSHDLVHESALRTVPQGVRQALHRQIAELLAEDAAASPARVAWHWEQGDDWAEAGRHWHAAGEAARRAGRLAEQADLFERAARCHQSAGDAGSQFEALHARLDGLQMRHGGGAVLAALPEVEALADTGLRRLRCRLSRADAWLDGEHATEAAEEAQAAVREAIPYPDLLAEAGALHALALGQRRQFDLALEAAENALAAAHAAKNPLQKLRALDAMSYVHYANGRLADALTWQLQAVAFAEAMGHRVEAIAGEGHVAALLAAIGDVPATYEQALRTRQRHRDIGLGDNSTLGSVNHIVLGVATAALGRFDEALEALQMAVATAGPQAAAAAQTKARIALANVWLTLGCPAAARTLMDELPAAIGPGMQMQAELVRARAAEGDGLSPQRHLLALQRLAAENSDLPLVVSAHFESSYAGDAAEVIDRMQRVRRDCEALGLHGTARALQWRELVRWLEIPGSAATAAALAHAKTLHPHAAKGLSAKCYPPQTWLTLSQAYARANESAQQAQCHAAARHWLSEALPRVPAEHRAAFAHANVVNRALLSADPAPSGP
jgi:DNA-binding SARP family transcriptional activator/tetratricopeptide (TPR) repeat protein